jgi:hypothetical protein
MHLLFTPLRIVINLKCLLLPLLPLLLPVGCPYARSVLSLAIVIVIVIIPTLS